MNPLNYCAVGQHFRERGETDCKHCGLTVLHDKFCREYMTRSIPSPSCDCPILDMARKETEGKTAFRVSKLYDQDNDADDR